MRGRQPPGGTRLRTDGIAKGIRFFGTFNRGGPVDEVLKETGTLNNNASVVATSIGYALECAFDGADRAEFNKHNEIHDELTAFTLFALVKNRKTSIVSSGGESPLSHSGGGDDPWGCFWQQSENFECTVDLGASSSTSSITDGLDNGSIGALATDWNAVGGIWDGANIIARVNHTKGSVVAAVGTAQASSDSNNFPRIGGTNDATNSWDGWVAIGVMWNRALSDAEWDSLVDNPWQLFAPRLQLIPVSAGVAPPVSPTGTVAVTLDDVTSTASGEVAFTGTLAETLADVTSAASGEQIFTGTLAETLADVTSTASGTTPDVVGSLSETLDDVTSTASGLQTFTGTLAETLEDVISTASGATADNIGTVAVTLDDVVSTASGLLTIPGTLAETLADVISTASGQLTIQGSLAETLADVVSTASGQVTFVGTLSETLDDDTSVVVGTVKFTGTLSETLADVAITASGTVTTTVTGTLSITLADDILAASGSTVAGLIVPNVRLTLNADFTRLAINTSLFNSRQTINT